MPESPQCSSQSSGQLIDFLKKVNRARGKTYVIYMYICTCDLSSSLLWSWQLSSGSLSFIRERLSGKREERKGKEKKKGFCFRSASLEWCIGLMRALASYSER